MKIINNVPCGYQKLFDKDYVFILLHMLIENKEYRDFYLDKKNDFKLIILDNSAFELGKSMDVKLLLSWGKKLREVHPESIIEIIIPDSYGNKLETLELMYDFFNNEDYDEYDFQYMAVPQGKNSEDLIECLNIMLKNHKISTIGINKLWSREDINHIVWNIQLKEKFIHKLGVNKLSDWNIKALRNIRSCDSRILSKIVTGNENPWNENLNEQQISILKRLIDEVNGWQDEI